MNKYEKVELEMIEFEEEDIITYSEIPQDSEETEIMP